MRKLTVYLAMELSFLRSSLEDLLERLNFIHEIKAIARLDELKSSVHAGIYQVLVVESAIVHQNKETISRFLSGLPKDFTALVFVTGKGEDGKFYEEMHFDDCIYLHNDTREVERKFKRIAINNLSGIKMGLDENWRKLSERTDLPIKLLKVLKRICEGRTSHQIADEFFVSKRTVDGYRRTLLQKTGTKTPGELITYAMKNDLFPELFL